MAIISFDYPSTFTPKQPNSEEHLATYYTFTLTHNLSTYHKKFTIPPAIPQII